MYASDITNRKRAETIYRNLQLQKEWFNSGKTIRILGQKGGNDYAYMTNLIEGCLEDTCGFQEDKKQITQGNASISYDTSNMTSLDIARIAPAVNGFNGIQEHGDRLYTYTNGVIGVIIDTLDDTDIPVSTGGTDFFFFNVNCGAANSIWWNTNNVILFGGKPPNEDTVNFGVTSGTVTAQTGSPLVNKVVSLEQITIPFVLLGNYDRRMRSFYTSNYISTDYSITTIITTFDDYFRYRVDSVSNEVIPPLTPNATGTFRIRLIRELIGENRQWIEVTVLNVTNGPLSSGYVSGGSYETGTNIDAQGYGIDPTKNNPFDISDGTKLLHICGSTYATVAPTQGTSFIFQSDAYGNNWTFTNNAHLNV